MGHILPTLVVLIALGLLSAAAHGQAWLPRQGTLDASLLYSNYLNKKHYLPNGDAEDVGHTRSHTVGLTGSYALTDRWMVSAGLPFVSARYEGHRAHPGEVDDGNYHGYLTDARVGVHFQAQEQPFALAPYVALVIPTNSYPTLGHAAPGRGLNEVWLGFFVGKVLDPWIPRTYLQARYNYAFVEEVVGVDHDRSNAELELGYFLNPRMSIRVVAAWQETHGGIDVPVPPSDPLFAYHDQLAAESFFNLGAGFAYTLNSRVSLFSLYLQSVDGRNGHRLDNGVTLGLSYSRPPR